VHRKPSNCSLMTVFMSPSSDFRTDYSHPKSVPILPQSVVWLGIWGYVIGVFWFLVGLLWAVATCCYFCCCREKSNKGSGYARGYYCCPAVMVVLLSAIAL
jgi:hypothetical protein